MPFAPHMRMTALGRLGASGERFSYGLALTRSETPGWVPPLAEVSFQEVCEDLAADVVAFHSSAAVNLSGHAILEGVKFAAIGADGRYTSDPFLVDVADTGGAAPFSGITDAILPQSALAISLNTARRGSSGRGRFYLPMPVVAVGGDMVVPEVIRDNMAAAAQTFLNNVYNTPGIDVTDLTPVVASTKGFLSAVTGVRVGRVIDTIRSRRRSIDEGYEAPLPVG